MERSNPLAAPSVTVVLNVSPDASVEHFTQVIRAARETLARPVGYLDYAAVDWLAVVGEMPIMLEIPGSPMALTHGEYNAKFVDAIRAWLREQGEL